MHEVKIETIIAIKILLNLFRFGDGDLDHAYWGRPEDMTMERPAWSITASQPGSDLAAETAAAFAAGYLVYRETGMSREIWNSIIIVLY